MLTLQTVFDQFTGKEPVEALIRTLEDSFQDFREVQQKYAQAMEKLQNDLGEISVDKEKEAIRQQIASTIFFSGVLGVVANLRYFSDPVSGDFFRAGPEVYLRENTAKNLPEYIKAQEIREQFYAGLTPAQKTLYEDVTEYVCYLESAGPKLAHYYGYLLGNELLYRIVPGYHPDMALTLSYCTMLEKHFGKRFDWNLPPKSSSATG